MEEEESNRVRWFCERLQAVAVAPGGKLAMRLFSSRCLRAHDMTCWLKMQFLLSPCAQGVRTEESVKTICICIFFSVCLWQKVVLLWTEGKSVRILQLQVTCGTCWGNALKYLRTNICIAVCLSLFRFVKISVYHYVFVTILFCLSFSNCVSVIHFSHSASLSANLIRTPTHFVLLSFTVPLSHIISLSLSTTRSHYLFSFPLSHTFALSILHAQCTYIHIWSFLRGPH